MLGPIVPGGGGRRAYRPDYFVGRQSELTKLRDWLAGNSQFCIVFGTPAIGKSWFLQAAKRKLFDEEGRAAFWLEVPIQNPRDGLGDLDQERLIEWVPQFITELRGKGCQNVRGFDPIPELASTMKGIGGDVDRCKWPIDGKVYIFIDQGDSLTPDAWRKLELDLIGPLAEAQKLRFLIALRDDQKLHSFALRRRSFRWQLSAFSIPDERGEHLEKLKEIEELPEEVKVLMDVLPGYSWDHPWLNDFLIQRIKTNRASQQPDDLDCDFLLDGLDSLNPQLCPITEEIIAQLFRFVQLGDEGQNWTKQDVKEELALSDTAAGARIRKLIGCHLVTLTPRGHFKVVDGVRQFIIAAKATGWYDAGGRCSSLIEAEGRD